MKKATIKFNYEEEKLKAIRVSLKEKGKDLEAEIESFLNNLYEKNVPKLLKIYVENQSNFKEGAN